MFQLRYIGTFNEIFDTAEDEIHPLAVEANFILPRRISSTKSISPTRKGGFRCSAAIAAEQKARATYDNILRLVDDPDVCDAIKFLRAREVVHYQRFCDALGIAQDHMDSKNFYGYNPAFDKSKKQ